MCTLGSIDNRRKYLTQLNAAGADIAVPSFGAKRSAFPGSGVSWGRKSARERGHGTDSASWKTQDGERGCLDII